MLFNSYEFIFLFFPVVAVGFFWIARSNHKLAALWLGAASLFFYGWWNPKFVLLLVTSILFNYGMGYWMSQATRTKFLLIFAVTANLTLLAYFKYANFFIKSVNEFSGSTLSLLDVVLPLGISFFTFTQITFLVDVHRKITREYNFIHYLLFVTYFPHLIAGPVLHHKQMMPQFASSAPYSIRARNFAIGLTIFTIGLTKKVLIADRFGAYASSIFDGAESGIDPKFFAAWTGALAYTLQLYFDFSGYTDMAIGISRMFGVKLPENFNSPYKAHNIIEFWRRWHMTLSQFLRDYLYFPLGGNRRGKLRRYANLLITMLLGGLWHGANWTYVAWGGLHGGYLVINHAWHGLRKRLRIPYGPPSIPGKIAGLALTFLAVVVAWVFFRANSFSTALSILSGMAGLNGLSLPSQWANVAYLTELFGDNVLFDGALESFNTAGAINFVLIFGLAMFVIWGLPNTRQLVSIIFGKKRSTYIWAIFGLIVGVIFVAMLSRLHHVSTFLYYQF